MGQARLKRIRELPHTSVSTTTVLLRPCPYMYLSRRQVPGMVSPLRASRYGSVEEGGFAGAAACPQQAAVPDLHAGEAAIRPEMVRQLSLTKN